MNALGFKNKFIEIVLVQLFFLLPILSIAQQRNCLYTSKSASLFFEDFWIETRDILIIPVVVHIVYHENERPLTDVQVQSQIAALNRDFQRLGNEWKKLPVLYRSLAADVGFEFCLANETTEGLPSSGITRTKTSITNIGLRDNIFYSDLGGEDAWPTDRYLNIWVGEMPEGILGHASGPIEAGTQQDGVVISSQYFGLSNALLPYQLGRTLVHEVGHYLGLEHPWGNVTNECEEDDHISDTPLQLGPHQGCPPTEFKGCEIEQTYWNFMDYTPDCCMALFTHEQAEFMRQVLLTYRSDLLNNNCLNTLNKIVKAIQIIPNPANEVAIIRWQNGAINYPERIDFFSSTGVLFRQIPIPPFRNQIELCLNTFPKGILLGKLYYNDGSHQTIKLIHME